MAAHPRRKRPRISRSAPSWTARAATVADMEYLVTRLTKGHLAELVAALGCPLSPKCPDCTPLALLTKHLHQKVVICPKGRETEPVAVFDGPIAPKGIPTGVLWGGFTEDLAASQFAWTFDLYCNDIFNHFHAEYPTIVTYVDTHNVRQSLWLERLGFKETEAIRQFGQMKLPFRMYQRKAIGNV